MDNGFTEEVYAVVGQIPYGKVLSYGMVARLAGRPGYARMVGRILSRVPTSASLPCHRVVNSSGRTTPHWREQSELLHSEGVTFRKNGCVDMRENVWEFPAEDE